MSTHDIRIALDGIVQLLSRNLYSHPDAFMREMLQNAHDSILKRRMREPFAAEIRVRVDRSLGAVEIEDNGVGLTQQEIADYLSTIGRSGTGELKASLASGDPVQLIGQFGIGLLSAFLVASEVEVRTRSALTGESWRWTFDGGARYELEPHDRRVPGTVVSLRLSPGSRGYLEVGALEALVQRYADLLPIPIFIGHDSRPANAIVAPWEEDASEERVQAYLQRRFPRLRPLLVLDVDSAEGEVHVQGALAIGDDPDRPGQVHLYVSRMYVASDPPDLLPPWASFVSGVISCDALTLVASRDRVLSDEALDQARALLERALLERLRILARREPARLNSLLRIHRRGLMALALREEHRDLFLHIAELMPMRSSLGPRSLPQLIEANPDGPRLRFITRREGLDTLRLLCESQDLPLVYADEPYAESFLRRFAETWPSRLEPTRLDAATGGGLVQDISPMERLRLAPLVTALAHVAPSHAVRGGRFAPSWLPILRLETAEGRSRRELEEVVENVGVPSFLKGALAFMAEAPEEPEAALVLNVDNPLVARMVEAADPDAEGFRLAVQVLADQAQLAAGVRPPMEERVQILARAAQALEALL
ncbi:MAG: ATP-binding protein [Alphaproteobacteria bacterium]|nr:ATP-binding protein [Alphaproteobacteria bacterium]